MNSLCTTPWKSKKKLSTWSYEFQLLRPRGHLTNPFRTLSLGFGIIGKTPGLTSRNNFVKNFFVCIGHRNNVLASCDSIFPLLRCQGVWNKTSTQMKNYKLGVVQRFCYHSWWDSMVIFDQISNSGIVYLSSNHFGWPPLLSSSSSSLLSRDQEYHLKTFDLFGASFP